MKVTDFKQGQRIKGVLNDDRSFVGSIVVENTNIFVLFDYPERRAGNRPINNIPYRNYWQIYSHGSPDPSMWGVKEISLSIKHEIPF